MRFLEAEFVEIEVGEGELSQVDKGLFLLVVFKLQRAVNSPLAEQQ